MKYFPVEIRFADIDAFGHVNNATFLTLVEQARVRFYDSMYKVEKPLDFPFVIVHAQIDYKKPLMLMDELEVGVSVGKVGKSSWDFHYELRNLKNQTVYAVAKTTQVYYSHETKSAARMPESFKQKLIEQTNR